MGGFVTKKKKDFKKFDLVIQGKYYDFTDTLVEEYLKVPFVNKIIVSCWEDSDVHINNERVTIKKNKYPTSSGNGNGNLQIISSLNGLKECTSEFAIKIRSDMLYTQESMMKMYDFFFEHHQQQDEKIFVVGVYPDLLFHPRDHFSWGKTESLINLFNIPLEKNVMLELINLPNILDLGQYWDCFTRVETYIGAHYCARFEPFVNKMLIKASEYLHDNSLNWSKAKEVSDSITFKVFKSFPKSAVDFHWLGKTEWNIPGIPWKLQPYLDDSFWHEDGY